jgi:hypothetical protein
MPNLFLKDENIEMSPPVVGYRMLNYIQQKGINKVSIFDLADHFKDEAWFSPKTLYFGMIFLFSLGLIEFNEPYVIKNAAN